MEISIWVPLLATSPNVDSWYYYCPRVPLPFQFAFSLQLTCWVSAHFGMDWAKKYSLWRFFLTACNFINVLKHVFHPRSRHFAMVGSVRVFIRSWNPNNEPSKSIHIIYICPISWVRAFIGFSNTIFKFQISLIRASVIWGAFLN